MLKLEFTDATAEGLNAQVTDYLSGIKKSRKGGKDEGAEGAQTGAAPAPIMPPPGGQTFQPQGAGGQAFAPPAPGAGPQGGAFPAPAVATFAPQPDPAAVALVQRINTRVDAAVASGQADAVLNWCRNQVVAVEPGAGNFTLDQCKQAFYKMTVPALENAAKLMNA